MLKSFSDYDMYHQKLFSRQEFDPLTSPQVSLFINSAIFPSSPGVAISDPHLLPNVFSERTECTTGSRVYLLRVRVDGNFIQFENAEKPKQTKVSVLARRSHGAFLLLQDGIPHTLSLNVTLATFCFGSETQPKYLKSNDAADNLAKEGVARPNNPLWVLGDD
ncbi:Uncharacterized protein TCM_044695 [Theobroma cacao]|uniref:Uncharacterized protein n=1 Tax=Theobroma cacao TaxID=3641 RepID=A0A061FRL5_THECC|nr:Uncharacterized protein TCM_044695 [Theobroma cacao]